MQLKKKILYFAEADEDELNEAKQELSHKLNIEKCDRAHHWIGDGYCDDDTNIEGFSFKNHTPYKVFHKEYPLTVSK